MQNVKWMASMETLAWVLPRPRMSALYRGGFPLWFEQKLLKLLDCYENGKKVLHVFGGKAEYGMRIDMNISVEPDVVADAHQLPFASNTFDLVIGDPPYTNELSASLYGTGKIKYKRWSEEAVRVSKPGGFVVVYHFKMLPCPKGASYHKRILLAVRVHHHLR